MAKKIKMPKMKAPKMPKMPKMPKSLSFLSNPVVICLIVVLVLAVVTLVVWNGVPTNMESFDPSGSEPTVALFYAPWCGHCETVKPIWDKLEKFHPNSVVSVNSDENKELAKKHDIQGFPTIKYLPNGLGSPAGVEEYEGERTYEALDNFVKSKIGAMPAKTSENPMPLEGNTMPVDPAGAGVESTSFVARNILPNAS